MIKKYISLSVAQARGIAFIFLSALLVACASLAAVFLLCARHVSAEEMEDGAAYDTLHADGGEDEEENFFDVYAKYAEEIEADQPVDAEDDEHHDHDETEDWQFYKADTSAKTQSYKLRARLAARGASVKEDVVKRRCSFGCDGI